MPTAILDLLKFHRTMRGLTQTQLAQQLRVSPRTLWKWENGEQPHYLIEHGLRTVLGPEIRRKPKPLPK